MFFDIQDVFSKIALNTAINRASEEVAIFPKCPENALVSFLFPEIAGKGMRCYTTRCFFQDKGEVTNVMFQRHHYLKISTNST